MYSNNEIMFPHYVIPSLRKLRGEKWRVLVERVAPLAEQDEEMVAFILMMVRINGCLSCETDSFRAMRGCPACAYQTLRRYKGDDDDLIAAFETALEDVRRFSQTQPRFGIRPTASLSDVVTQSPA